MGWRRRNAGWTVSLATLVAVAACAEQPRLVEPRPVAPVAPPPSAKAPEARARPAPKLEEPEQPEEGQRSDEDFAQASYRGPTACNVVMQVGPARLVPFRSARGKAPFGSFGGSQLRVVVPNAPGAPRELFVTSDSGGFVVHGVAEADDVELHPSAPLLLAEYMMLGAEAKLTLTGASIGVLEVRYAPGADEPVRAVPSVVEGSAACSGVTLATEAFSSAAGLSRNAVGTAWLKRRDGVPLAREAGGRAVARLSMGEACVFVLGRAKGQVGVAIRRSTDTLVGWVPESALDLTRECTVTTAGTLGHGAGVGPGSGLAGDSARCPRDLSLSVTQGATREVVGFVRANTLVQLETPGDGDVVVRVPASAKLGLEGDARFVVKRADLEGCSVRRAPSGLKSEHRSDAWPHGAAGGRPASKQ